MFDSNNIQFTYSLDGGSKNYSYLAIFSGIAILYDIINCYLKFIIYQSFSDNTFIKYFFHSVKMYGSFGVWTRKMTAMVNLTAHYKLLHIIGASFSERIFS